jgi:hypothetical protein
VVPWWPWCVRRGARLRGVHAVAAPGLPPRGEAVLAGGDAARARGSHRLIVARCAPRAALHAPPPRRRRAASRVPREPDTSPSWAAPKHEAWRRSRSRPPPLPLPPVKPLKTAPQYCRDRKAPDCRALRRALEEVEARFKGTPIK